MRFGILRLLGRPPSRCDRALHSRLVFWVAALGAVRLAWSLHPSHLAGNARIRPSRLEERGHATMQGEGAICGSSIPRSEIRGGRRRRAGRRVLPPTIRIVLHSVKSGDNFAYTLRTDSLSDLRGLVSAAPLRARPIARFPVLRRNALAVDRTATCGTRSCTRRRAQPTQRFLHRLR